MWKGCQGAIRGDLEISVWDSLLPFSALIMIMESRELSLNEARVLLFPASWSFFSLCFTSCVLSDISYQVSSYPVQFNFSSVPVISSESCPWQGRSGECRGSSSFASWKIIRSDNLKRYKAALVTNPMQPSLGLLTTVATWLFTKNFLPSRHDRVFAIKESLSQLSYNQVSLPIEPLWPSLILAT